MIPPPKSLPQGVCRDVSLAPYTTLGVGGPAQFFVSVRDTQHLKVLMGWAQAHTLCVTVLGGGSNVLVHDDGVLGLVVRLAPKPAMPTPDACGQAVCVTFGGGDDWCTAVAHTVAHNLYGIECLAGIPGQVGAAPVQNIGAYGQELSHTLVAVEALDTVTMEVVRLPAHACGLGYRTSHFKTRWHGRYIITAVTLRLQRTRQEAPSYPDLVAELAKRQVAPPAATAQALADAVVARRQAKGMVWQADGAGLRSVGSFFVNPQVSPHTAAQLTARWPTMPQWPTDPPGAEPAIKLSAAWLIEASGMHPGWLCHAVGDRVGLSPRHALALINTGHATANDVCVAATLIYERVLAQTGVALSAEARCLGFGALAPPMGAL